MATLERLYELLRHDLWCGGAEERVREEATDLAQDFLETIRAEARDWVSGRGGDFATFQRVFEDTIVRLGKRRKRGECAVTGQTQDCVEVEYEQDQVLHWKNENGFFGTAQDYAWLISPFNQTQCPKTAVVTREVADTGRLYNRACVGLKLADLQVLCELTNPHPATQRPA